MWFKKIVEWLFAVLGVGESLVLQILVVVVLSGIVVLLIRMVAGLVSRAITPRLEGGPFAGIGRIVTGPGTYFLVLLALRAVLQSASIMSPLLGSLIDSGIIVCMAVILVRLAGVVIGVWGRAIASRTRATLDNILLPLVEKSVKAGIVAVFALMILEAWGIEVRPFLATLGIGGVAVGFAVKDSLANIFGGVSLLLDGSFRVGDKVEVVGKGITGVVEDVGLRTTKIRTFDNEILLVPNGDLSNTIIRNFARPSLRQRVVVNFGVAYGSDPERVRECVLEEVGRIENCIEDPAPQVLFTDMADFALQFSARFWVPEYGMAWAAKLAAVDAIHARLNRERIEIPFPTRTIYTIEAGKA